MSKEKENDVSFGDLLVLIWAQRYLVLIAAFVGSLVGLIVAFALPPSYRIEAVLMPVADGDSGGLAALASQLGGLASIANIRAPGRGGPRDEAIALLESQSITSNLINKRQLLPRLFHKRWNEPKNAWDVSADDVPTIWMGLKKFERIRTVSENPKTGLIKVTLVWSDPEAAAAWIRDLVDMVNSEMRSGAIVEAQQSIEFLTKELDRTQVVEIRKSIYDLIESQTKALTMASVRKDYAFRMIDPPVVPDIDDETFPNKWLVSILGLLVGVMFGIVLALLRHGRTRVDDQASPMMAADQNPSGTNS